MRLACLVMMALLAGCLGPVDANESPRDEGSMFTSETGGSVDAGPGQAGNAPGDPGGEPDAPEAGSDSNDTAPEPPAPMHWEGGMGLVAIPAADPWPECEAPLTGCDGPFFSIEGTFDLEATLSWDMPTTDLDLYLCRWTDKHCDEISRDGINNKTDPPTTRQVLRHADLPPGYYRLWIVPQHGIHIEYELDAVFR